MATCKQQKTEDSVLQQLKELFGSVLHLDVIKTVAVSCQYDVIKSSDKLLEITSRQDAQQKMENGSKSVVFNEVSIQNRLVSLSNSASTASLASNKSRKANDIEKTISYIQQGFKVLILMRGLPGSGKSTLARHILESTIGYDGNRKMHLLSTDDYFCLNKQGVYNYDASKIDVAHNWNQNRAFQSMSKGFSPVIIDNTNVQMWELKPYATMGTDYGYIIVILEPDTHWCFDDKELTKRNTHGVPRAKIKDMLGRYEKNITARKLLSAYNLYYKLQKPPQLRLYPPPDRFTETSNRSPNYAIVKPETATLLNHQNELVKRCVIPIETINLMQFDEELSTKGQSSKGADNSSSPWEQNPVDKILMYDDDNESTKVLKPQQNENETIVIDSDSDDGNTDDNKLFPNIESAWGINENALRSWKIVTSIHDNGNKNEIVKPAADKQGLSTVECGINTEGEYFQLLNNLSIASSQEVEVKVLNTVSRDINRSVVRRNYAMAKKLKLDKSCMTEDVFDDYENHMTQLESLFPDVPVNHLNYWYRKCKGDLEWTIEFLLEAKEEITTLIDNESIKEDGEVNENDNENDVSAENDFTNLNESQKSFKERKVRNRLISEENVDLKKLIESKIEISNEHYSQHLQRIKSRTGHSSSSGLSTSHTEVKHSNENDNRSRTSSSTSSNGKEIIDLDMEFDEVDIPELSQKTDQKEEETIELNLGEHFVAQLEEKFGDTSISYPKGFQPVVQMPVTLARQLYTFYLESVYQQMENHKQIMEEMTKEDEEFARKLQASEQENESSYQAPSTPNFQEIMKEQMNQSLHQKEVDKWKNLNLENLALKLTRQKLFDSFPTIERDTLVEILFAHDNKYIETVESLLASSSPEIVRGNVEDIKVPPIQDEVLQEMKDAQNHSASEEYKEIRHAQFYRDEASKYLKKRQELYQKAQQYYQKGMKEVAQFYSGLATQQTEFFERANSFAATAFLDEHFKRLQNFNTLDLHFLYVKEALPALDMFLDRSINLLRTSKQKQSEYLQIITGRGKRSENGVSKIKPVVQARLKRRKINFVQLNPGLLKVKVTKSSLVTSELSTD